MLESRGIWEWVYCSFLEWLADQIQIVLSRELERTQDFQGTWNIVYYAHLTLLEHDIQHGAYGQGKSKVFYHRNGTASLGLFLTKKGEDGDWVNGRHSNSVPVQVEGSDLCVVSLKVGEVEEVWRSFLFPSLPGTRAHKHSGWVCRSRVRVCRTHDDLIYRFVDDRKVIIMIKSSICKTCKKMAKCSSCLALDDYLIIILIYKIFSHLIPTFKTEWLSQEITTAVI